MWLGITYRVLGEGSHEKICMTHPKYSSLHITIIRLSTPLPSMRACMHAGLLNCHLGEGWDQTGTRSGLGSAPTLDPQNGHVPFTSPKGLGTFLGETIGDFWGTSKQSLLFPCPKGGCRTATEAQAGILYSQPAAVPKCSWAIHFWSCRVSQCQVGS